jgi:hypothetical protein
MHPPIHARAHHACTHATAYTTDPLGFGKDPAKRERYALSELKNGRLAMIAIGAWLGAHAMFIDRLDKRTAYL